ncbi:MAG: ankyrin repeat domain-containing protein [Rhodocyclaceae bacterium]|nr:ankyrin repeat domain-containing protein [Rhodocyclaceae bacterium]
MSTSNSDTGTRRHSHSKHRRRSRRHRRRRELRWLLIIVGVPVVLLALSGWIAHHLQNQSEDVPSAQIASRSPAPAPRPTLQKSSAPAVVGTSAIRRCPRLTDEVPPLVEASACGDHPRIERLLTEGTDVHLADSRPSYQGQTALHHATARGDMVAMTQLLRAGASADRTDAAGNTPLHLLALDDKLVDDIAIARQLIQAGADISRRNNAGYTVIDELRARPRLARARAELAAYLDATAAQLAKISKARAYLDRRAPAPDQLSVLELDSSGADGPVQVAGARANEDALRALVAAWAGAWSARNVDTYLSFYGTDFAPDGGISRAQWEAQRRQQIGGVEQITVIVDKLEFELDGNRAVAHFIQTFRTPNYREEGPKTLVLARDGEHWSIVAEHVGR